MRPVITAFDWVPDFAKGQVRDLRLRWALEEVGQSYETLYLRQGEQKRDAHRTRQPFGQVPTYQEDELVLFESGAIVLHIAERFGGDLLPADPAGRIRAIEWIFAALNSIEPSLMDHGMCAIFEADQPWSAPRMPAVLARIDGRLAALSHRLGDREWLEDDGFTAGDLIMVTVLRIVAGDFLLAPYPNLSAYVARGEARPAFQRALADQMAGFTGAPPPGFAEWEARIKARQGEPAWPISKDS
ncbi:glutathione S-transferase [Sphingomonas jinjuensis]|uniref:Glutathione S-transferase n=1 Tax=Sphingomonas jinjuensis TaxID=535907 RepID=A0A840FQD0_9SPHN|nr:glutathione S-transferase family protein [Sphingomonas jinjuensis]MBB4155475.1 glutathione S-transferase [Sphingomonas jinjuensis]